MSVLPKCVIPFLTATVLRVYWLMLTASFCYTLFTLLLCLMHEITIVNNSANVSLVFIQNYTDIIEYLFLISHPPIKYLDVLLVALLTFNK